MFHRGSALLNTTGLEHETMENAPAPVIAAIDVVGYDEGRGGRSCATHAVCVQHVKVDDVLIFREEVVCVTENDLQGDLEYVVKAFVLRAGCQACHVGYLPRRLLRARKIYANKMATVVEDLRLSDNSQKRRRSEQNKGIVRCLLLNDVEQQFRAKR